MTKLFMRTVGKTISQNTQEICKFAMTMGESFSTSLKIEGIKGINMHKYIVEKDGWVIDEVRSRYLGEKGIEDEVIKLNDIKLNKEYDEIFDHYLYFKTQKTSMVGKGIFLLTILLENDKKDYLLIDKKGNPIKAFRPSKT